MQCSLHVCKGYYNNMLPGGSRAHSLCVRTLDAVHVRVETSYSAAGPSLIAAPGLGSFEDFGRVWDPNFLGFEDVAAISGHQNGLSVTGALA